MNPNIDRALPPAGLPMGGHMESFDFT